MIKPPKELRVVLLAAGASKRFLSTGNYLGPKCLLPIGPIKAGEEPNCLLTLAIKTARAVTQSRPIVIASPEVKAYILRRKLDVLTHVPEEVLNGAAYSLARADDFIWPSDGVLVLDTDNIYTSALELQDIASAIINDKSVSSGVLFTNVPGSRRFKFLEREPDGNTILSGYARVSDFQKVCIDVPTVSDFNICIGAYVISSWDWYMKEFVCLSEIHSTPENSGQELSVLTVFVSANKFGVPILKVDYPFLDWIPCGTPLQYEKNRRTVYESA